ncbi:MAG: class I SAM-dependent methyltransferase [Cyanobacteriota bacterium]|nr:class I SAM-dependent methyltransferase [Cyanobacteriota bacterium]
MDDREVGQFWEKNAPAWTALTRQGYDICRDSFNTPAFLEILPDIKGLKGLDIGCGEGYNTRKLACLGGKIVGIDISSTFIQAAIAQENSEPLGIDYQVASALELPFEDESFDFATAFMSLMDVSDYQVALREAFRVLKPGGFLQFSITHPCFDTPHRKNVRDENRKVYAVEIGGYFERVEGEISEWMFSSIPEEFQQQWPDFRIPYYHYTISEWLNLLIDVGFVLEKFVEPKPNDAVVTHHPNLQGSQVVAYFLQIRCRKL